MFKIYLIYIFKFIKVLGNKDYKYFCFLRYMNLCDLLGLAGGYFIKLFEKEVC